MYQLIQRMIYESSLSIRKRILVDWRTGRSVWKIEEDAVTNLHSLTLLPPFGQAEADTLRQYLPAGRYQLTDHFELFMQYCKHMDATYFVSSGDNTVRFLNVDAVTDFLSTNPGQLTHIVLEV